MRMMPSFFGLAAIAAAAISAPAIGKGEQIGRWELLGSREINLVQDRDSIRVGRGEGGFRQIKLNVKHNAVRVEDLVVIYANGAPDRIPMRALITPRADSRVIDLRGGKRAIRRIDMVLKSVPNGRGRATVEVWGRH